MEQDRIYQYEPLWGEWYVKGFIGEGSFGKVYIIEKTEDGQAYHSAVKLITIPTQQQRLEAQRNFGSDAGARSHYYGEIVDSVVTEINLLNRLAGSGYIVEYKDHKVFRSGDTTDILIRMEMLTDIRTHYAQHPASVRDIIRMARDVCMGLSVCAKYGVVHRDIKLDNIFMSEHGLYKIGDFGVSRFMGTSGASTVVGTYDYMAPEVVREGRYDGRVDIYSLGLVLYRLLNNDRMPFMPAYPAETKMRDRDEAYRLRMTGAQMLPPANAPAALWTAIQKACAYDANVRYASAEELREALEDAEREISREELNRAVYPPASMDKAVQQAPAAVPIPSTPADAGTGTMPIPGMPNAQDRSQTVSVTEAARAAQPAGAHYDAYTRRCVRCGAALREGEIFCTQCGALNQVVTYEKEVVGKAPVKPKRKREHMPKAWVAALIIGIAVLLGGLVILDFYVHISGANAYFIHSIYHIYDYYPIIELYAIVTIMIISGFFAMAGFFTRKKKNISRIFLLVGSNLLACLGIIVQLYNGYFMWYFAVPMVLFSVILTALYVHLRIEDRKQDGKEDKKGGAERTKVYLRAFTVILAVAIAACGFAVFAPAGEGEAVTFEDKNLEHVIREFLNKRLGAITTGDMAKVDYIDGWDRGIYNIEPLKYCINATEIYLCGNQISDISALSGLKGLTYLHLAENNISDISALSGLTSLRELHLWLNNISNISALSRLTSLTYLGLSDNSVSNIDALSGLTSLERLGLRSNNVSNIDALSGLTNLTYLDLSYNPISDIGALAGLINLTELGLDGNNISDISVLSGLTSLTDLDLDGNNISDIRALLALTNLNYLTIDSDHENSEVIVELVQRGCSISFY